MRTGDTGTTCHLPLPPPPPPPPLPLPPPSPRAVQLTPCRRHRTSVVSSWSTITSSARQLSSLVEQTGQWQIVGEAVDGLDAIAKAAAVQPDLILLDVELPLFNGLEAARRIVAADPAARILFVSGHREQTSLPRP